MARTIARNSLQTTEEQPTDSTDSPVADTKEMSFLEHLEELRWHLMRAVIAIAVGTISAFSFPSIVFHYIILGPSRANFITYRLFCELSPSFCIQKINFIIQSRTPGGQLLMHLSSSLVVGLVIAFPYVFWEIWRFVKPGLYMREIKTTQFATLYVSVLFLLGIGFGYFILAPLSINFLANYQIDVSISNQFDITAYVSTLTTLVLGCGLLFQLPAVVYLLASAEIITARFMQLYRRHAVVLILIIAAVVTPPDVFSQVIVAIPLYFLYEISIYIAQSVERQKAKSKK